MHQWIFTDGSCTTHVDPAGRRAGWAAVEVAPYLINGQLVKISALWGTLPAAWPQSAPASEFCALVAAAEAMAVSEEARIFSDCRGRYRSDGRGSAAAAPGYSTMGRGLPHGACSGTMQVFANSD